jgi:hypothetical protein
MQQQGDEWEGVNAAPNAPHRLRPQYCNLRGLDRAIGTTEQAAVELEPWVYALCDEHACGAIIPSCCEILRCS